MIVALAGALLVALWVATIHDIQRDARVEKLAIERQTMSLARVFEEHTVRTLGAVDQALRFVKFQYERAGDSFDIASAVEQGTIESSLFHQVGVIDSNGIYHLSNLPDFKRVDLSDREHFRVHVQSDSRTYFVSKPVLGRATGAWSVQLTRRVNRNDGSLGGVAVISIDPFYFTAFYNEVDVGKKGVVALVGLDGIIRARRSGDEMAVGQDVNRSSLFTRLQDAPLGHYTAQSVIDGRTRVHSYRKLPDVPLVVVAGRGRGFCGAPGAPPIEARVCRWDELGDRLVLRVVHFADTAAAADFCTFERDAGTCGVCQPIEVRVPGIRVA